MVDGAGKSVGNNERRRGQVVGTSVGMDTSLEVSVSRKDSRGDQIVVDDTVLYLVRDLTRVTNAGHASISSGGETKSVKSILKSSFLVVLGNNVGAG